MQYLNRLESLNDAYRQLSSWDQAICHEYVPVTWLELLHALNISIMMKRAGARGTFTTKMVAMLALAFGGSTIASVLAGAPTPWLYSERTVLGFVAVHMFIFYFPFNLPYIILARTPVLSLLVDHVLLIADAIRRSLAVTAIGVDLHGRGKVFASLVLGTLCGCGGGILNGMFGLSNRRWKLATPSHFTSKSWDFRLCALTAAVYVALVFESPFQRPLQQLIDETLFLRRESWDSGAAKVVAATTMVVGVLTKKYWYFVSEKLGKKAEDSEDSDSEQGAHKFSKKRKTQPPLKRDGSRHVDGARKEKGSGKGTTPEQSSESLNPRAKDATMRKRK